MNIGEERETAYARYVKATKTARNTEGIDGIYQDGTTYEFKTLIGSKPSVGGKKTLQGQTSIRTAIKNYLKADFLVVETEKGCYLKMNREMAVEWLTARVVISKASEKRGGWDKLRIVKNPRTAKATESIVARGYAIA